MLYKQDLDLQLKKDKIIKPDGQMNQTELLINK